VTAGGVPHNSAMLMKNPIYINFVELCIKCTNKNTPRITITKPSSKWRLQITQKNTENRDFPQHNSSYFKL